MQCMALSSVALHMTMRERPDLISSSENAYCIAMLIDYFHNIHW
jgi:hypothetical protein